MAKYQQGRFQPKNVKKYKGNPCEIFYRSSWELNFMSRLDLDANVVEWASELPIPYIGIDNKRHRYFVDFYVKTRSADGKMVEMLIEIKPDAQQKMPVKKANTPKAQKRYINECLTYETNQRKWAAAQNVCAQRGWLWKVIGEKDLGL